MRNVLVLLVCLCYSFSGRGQDTTRISLLFVGDIMQHDSNIAAAYDVAAKKFDYSACFEYVAPILRSADLTIGNLELTLAGSPYKGYPQFSAPDELVRELKRAGVDVLVTANNHSLDRGRKGLERTLQVLDTLQIQHTGTFRDSAQRALVYPLLVHKNGFTFSLLNYTYGTNGIPVTKPNVINLIDTVRMKKDFAIARTQQADAIIVFLHWGAEYQSLPNKEQKRLAAMCFREGATLVIGAHPHVLQPMEWNKEKNRLIAYSLGNFVSGQRPRYRDGGAMLWIEMEKVKTDSVTQHTAIKNAAYELAWVSKSMDEKKEFVMYPFRYFENDTLMVRPAALQQAFRLFKEDSRALYAKHNVNIAERKSEITADSVSYSIRLGVVNESDSLLMDDELLKFYGIRKEQHEPNQYVLFAGTFYERDLAMHALVDILSKTPFKRARVVRRIE